MKSIRIGLSVFMLILTGLAWLNQAGSLAKNSIYCQNAVEEAQRLMEEKLYQKAIASLEGALDIRESPETRYLWRDAYRLAYEDGVVTEKQYISAMETVAELQPDLAENWEQLIGFCLERENYKAAHVYSLDAEEAGVSGEKLAEYQRQADYAYRIRSKIFARVLQSPSGYSTVNDGSGWGILDQNGEWLEECSYDFISPVSDNLSRIVKTGEDLRIVDRRGIVQAFFPEEAENARAIEDGVLPVLCGDGWRYYDSAVSEFIPGSYEDASSFADGIAAVKENGSWKLMDRSGNTVGGAAFEDIKLYGSGEYLHDGIFVAKSGGTYGLYNQKAELTAGITCSDMDVYMGEGIAYQDQSGKWGFLSKKGEVVIEPRFDGAKSFSGGLAAVCMDGQWGFIDSSGELVIDCQFLDTGYFTSGGLCFVSKLKGEYYMINLRFPKG